MSHDTTLTRPIVDPSAASPTAELPLGETPRRRLGSWQVAPGATQDLPSPAQPWAAPDPSATVPLAQPAEPTAPLPPSTGLAGRSTTPDLGSAPSPVAPEASAPTVRFPLPVPAATAPMSASEWATAPIAGGPATSEIGLAAPSRPLPGALQVTAPMPGRGAAGDVTATFPAGTPAAPTRGELDATVRLPGGVTVPIALGDTVELTQLRGRLDEDPDDLDAALELALALQEVGRDADATVVLTSLLTHYERSGSEDEAAQIRRLIGSAVTAPMPTDGTAPTREITAGAPTATMPTADLAGADGGHPRRTAPLPPSHTTAQLTGRTAALDHTSGRRDRRAKPRPAQPDPLLPRADMAFTDPLPALDGIGRDAVELLDAAEREREARHLRAALDSLTLAIALSPSTLGLWLRAAEVRVGLGHLRRATALLRGLLPLTGDGPTELPRWSVERVLLHTAEPDVAGLGRVVDLLVDAGQTKHAATYASALIKLLATSGDHDGAIQTASRMAALLPGETQVALEGAVLAVRHASHGEVIDLWEAAIAAGGDPQVARASMAASVACTSEDDHWRLLAEILPSIRQHPASLTRDAYLRTASAAGEPPALKAGRALVLHASDHPAAKDALAGAAGDRHGTAVGRAAASIALADRLASEGKGPEYVAAVRTTLGLMGSDAIAGKPDWRGLTGVEPDLAELSTELGEALLEAGDAAGAVEVLRVWHTSAAHHPPLVRLLADAYARTGQVGSALTILDELAMHHRKAGQLDEMAAVLRQMSRLAPSNMKVKSRLIDAYLQRGFVSEARAELIQRADLETQAGQPKEACRSLQRAADLSWNLGLMNEAFGLYDRLLEIDPEDVANRSALVNLYLQVGRLTEAAEHQRAVVDLALRNGRKHEAIAALHQVIGLTPDDMTSYYQLGELLSSMAEYHQAEKVYRRIVLMTPDDAVAQAKATAMAALKEQMTAV